MLDGVGDQLLHRVQVGVAHRGQLDRRQVEVVLDAVLDAHRHQRIQAELDQRHLPGQVLGLVSHGGADDVAQPVGDRLAGVRAPLGEVRAEIGAGGEVVGDERLVGLGFGFGRRRGGDLGDGSGADCGRQGGLLAAPGHDRVVDEGERFVDPGVHLHAGPARMPGQRRDQPCPVTGHRPLLRGGELGIRKHCCGSGFHQCRQVGGGIGARQVLPHVAPVRGGDVITRHDRRAVTGELGLQPVRLALEAGGRDVRVVGRGVQRAIRRQREQRAEVQIVAVDEQVRHRGRHRVDLVLLARQRRDQLRVVQSGRRGGQTDLHQRHRVGRQLQERGVTVVHGITDAVGEVDAVAQALLPVVHVVDGLRTGANQAALVHGGVVRRLQRMRFDALQFGGELTEQRIHLRGVAGALGLELPRELSLRFGAGDDRVDLVGRPADDGLCRCGVDAHLETVEVGEHGLDLLRRILDQGHQADVLAEQHGLALAHQVRARADGARGILQRQPTGEVGRGGLAERLAHQRTGFRAVGLEHLAEGDLDREDDQLDLLDRELGRLVGVVDRVVEDQLEDRVPTLVLHQGVDLVDPFGEGVVAQVQALGHLAVLGAETGQHPDRPVGDRPVGGQHHRVGLALGQRAHALDRLVMIVGQHHRARTAVVAPRQRPPDRFQRRRPTFRAVQPVGQLGRGGALTRGEETRNRQRHNRLRRVFGFRGGELLARDLQQTQRLVGQSGQLRLVLDRATVQLVITASVIVVLVI